MMEIGKNKEPAHTIHCSAGCKRTQLNIDTASASGWELLPISNRWRCGHCGRELRAVNEQSVKFDLP